jgi:glutathionylspermidine synthase
LVALIHATAYSDDRQVMIYIARELEKMGLKTTLISPAQLLWKDGQVSVKADFLSAPIDFMMRFFPAEWLPDLPRSSGWQHFFYDYCCPACNPTSALIVQSKRFPLIWEYLKTPIPEWRALLPETRDPRQARGDDWVLKPMLGRAGEDIGIPGVTPPNLLKPIRQSARRRPQSWIAQRRFELIPYEAAGRKWYPCIGVYTINGQAVGAYGRLGSQPITDATALDTAILLAA